MKFYVDILGFEEDKRTIEIFPTSNDWDLGFIDLYTLETSYNDIKFQCRYNEEIFSYFPQSNNNVWSLNSYWKETNINLVGSQLEVNDLLWIENERVKITSIVDTGVYTIERGVNGSIPIYHYYSSDIVKDTKLPITYLTLKRLSPIGLICKFYSTDNIGGNVIVRGYGKISEIVLTNNNIVTVNCKQLVKTLETPVIYDSGHNINYQDTDIINFNFISQSQIINEFFYFVSNIDIINNLNLIEVKRYSESSNKTIIIDIKDWFNQTLKINNIYIIFNNIYQNDYKYYFKKLEIPISTDINIVPVFISSYFNIKDCNISIKPFEKINSIECKYKLLEDSLPVKFIDKTITLKDDIIKMVSTKKLNYNIDKIIANENLDIASIIKDKIYFLNQVYDILEISTTKWFRKFDVGGRYIFNDYHLIKSFCQQSSSTIYVCLGYEDNKVRFFSYDNYTRYLVSMFSRIIYDNENDEWECIINEYIINSEYIPPQLIPTISKNQTLRLYTYDKINHTFSESDIVVDQYLYDLKFKTSDITYDNNKFYYISYKIGNPTTNSKESYFLYENYGIV